MNYKNENSIHIDQSVPLINQFINTTSLLLNQFSDLYESKVFEIDKWLDDIEATLWIYEEKLNSLPKDIFDNLQVDYQRAVMPTSVRLNQHNEQMNMTGDTTMITSMMDSPLAGVPQAPPQNNGAPAPPAPPVAQGGPPAPPAPAAAGPPPPPPPPAPGGAKGGPPPPPPPPAGFKAKAPPPPPGAKPAFYILVPYYSNK